MLTNAKSTKKQKAQPGLNQLSPTPKDLNTTIPEYSIRDNLGIGATDRTRLCNRVLRSQLKATMTGSSGAPQPAAPQLVDWLPYQRTSSLPLKAPIMQLVGAQKHRDWFLAFVWLLHTDLDNGNKLQSKMLFKFYTFMCDFFPQGLTDNLSHFNGDEVMEYLTHHNETSISRHAVTVSAKKAFTKLEEWMGHHTHWQQALDHAKSQYEQRTGPGRKPKKHGWKAPGLQSPAGMMAVLVLAHPDDTKFKDVISRLQIQWMMLLDREVFEVREGFWQGITEKNLYSVFFASEARDAMEPLIADYSQMFGSNFPDCRRNIIPYLPPWARQITLTEDPSGSEHGQAVEASPDEDSDYLSDVPSDDLSGAPENDLRDAGEEADKPSKTVDTIVCDENQGSEEALPPAINALDIHTLRHHLEPHDSSSAAEEWLFQSLEGADSNGVLSNWVLFWDGQISKVENAAAQVITRELFSQSLCRVKRLMSASMQPMANAYMLVDMFDGRLEDVTPSSFSMAKQLLDDFPAYRSYTDAFDKFKSTIDIAGSPEAKDLLDRLFQMQTTLFHHLTLGTTFFEYWQDVTLFETLRTHILIEDVQNISAEVEYESDLIFWRSQKDLLLQDETAASLQLTPWQRRALVWPGSGYRDILTPSQESYFRSKTVRGIPLATKDPSLVGPLTDSNSSSAARSAVARHLGLHKLLGPLMPELQQIPSGDSCHTPSTPVRPSSLTISPVTTMAPALPSTILTPSETASSSRTMWKRTPSTGVSNLYAGKTSSKRAASPDRRHVKSAKLDWKEELKNDITNLANESRSVMSEVQSLKNDITHIQASLAESKSNTMQAEIAELREGVNNIQTDLAEIPRTNPKSDIARLKSSIEADVATLQTNNVRIQKEIIELKTSVYNLGPSLIQSTKSQITSLKDDINKELTSLRTEMEGLHAATQRAPSKLGEDGFLSHGCPAPSGWNQREYEAELERAALSYICLHGEPEDGFGEDQDCLQETLETFPSLDEAHIATALQHIHMRVYHRPIGNHSLEDSN